MSSAYLSRKLLEGRDDERLVESEQLVEGEARRQVAEVAAAGVDHLLDVLHVDHGVELEEARELEVHLLHLRRQQDAFVAVAVVLEGRKEVFPHALRELQLLWQLAEPPLQVPAPQAVRARQQAASPVLRGCSPQLRAQVAQAVDGVLEGLVVVEAFALLDLSVEFADLQAEVFDGDGLSVWVSCAYRG